MDRILIVEDDRFYREMFANLLKADGYEVECASCGNDALAMLADQNYGLVITDLIMPDISGIDILSRIKETEPGIDVIMVTGNANLESAVFALKHGARDYLTKPVDPDEFRHTVTLCLEQRRLLDENEDLKNMLNLYQSSQAIAGCIELDKIYHLAVDALAREIGVGRGIGILIADESPVLVETKGLGPELAEKCVDALRGSITKHAVLSHMIAKTRIGKLLTGASADIEEAGLFFIRNKKQLLGVIALFNDPETRLPDYSIKKKNILFLLEQSLRALLNAENYSLAKDMLFIDDLSGLFNHRYLEVALDRELKRAERYASSLSVLFLDIDTFKQVNDTHGHLVGSRVLQEIGLLLKKAVRDVDVVIRYGGDEYTLLLVETGNEAARLVAERIRSLIASHCFLASEGYNIRLTCSIGYVCCPEDTLSKSELLDMADKAMYAGKASGKNCVCRFTKPT